MNLAYATELSLEPYQLFESLLTPPNSISRPRSVNLMPVLQAIMYVLVAGCAWRLLPNEYPPYSTVYYFSKWRNDGRWKRIHDHLVQWVRVTDEHDPFPSAASLGSQTVPTAVMVHEAVGYDGGKKIKGRKRFTLVDTLGLLIAVRVVAGSVPEREGAKQLLNQVHQERRRLPRLVHIWVDGGFEQTFSIGSWIPFVGFWRWFCVPKGLKDSCSCRSGGLWNGLMVGCIGAVVSLLTTNAYLLLPRHLFISG